jgi:uncharacterized protein (DUF1697 family)
MTARAPKAGPGSLRRYAAFLRGVSPMNAKMEELRAAFEAAGFSDVVTVQSSGNVLFSARPAPGPALERKAEAAMAASRLGRSFLTIVRPVDDLRALLEADPWSRFRLPPGAKRVVTFLRAAPPALPALPLERDGARILAVEGREVIAAYVPHPSGPVFMVLLQKAFGEVATTRTRDTVQRIVSQSA